jgi:hypothetical protein
LGAAGEGSRAMHTPAPDASRHRQSSLPKRIGFLKTAKKNG